MILQYLDSGLPVHQITSCGMLSIRSLIKIFQVNRLVSVQLMRNECLTSHMRNTNLDTVTCFQDLDRGIIPVSKVYDLLRFMTFWTRLFLNKKVIYLIFSPF